MKNIIILFVFCLFSFSVEANNFDQKVRDIVMEAQPLNAKVLSQGDNGYINMDHIEPGWELVYVINRMLITHIVKEGETQFTIVSYYLHRAQDAQNTVQKNVPVSRSTDTVTIHQVANVLTTSIEQHSQPLLLGFLIQHKSIFMWEAGILAFVAYFIFFIPYMTKRDKVRDDKQWEDNRPTREFMEQQKKNKLAFLEQKRLETVMAEIRRYLPHALKEGALKIVLIIILSTAMLLVSSQSSYAESTVLLNIKSDQRFFAGCLGIFFLLMGIGAGFASLYKASTPRKNKRIRGG